MSTKNFDGFSDLVFKHLTEQMLEVSTKIKQVQEVVSEYATKVDETRKDEVLSSYARKKHIKYYKDLLKKEENTLQYLKQKMTSFEECIKNLQTSFSLNGSVDKSILFEAVFKTTASLEIPLSKDSRFFAKLLSSEILSKNDKESFLRVFSKYLSNTPQDISLVYTVDVLTAVKNSTTDADTTSFFDEMFKFAEFQSSSDPEVQSLFSECSAKNAEKLSRLLDQFQQLDDQTKSSLCQRILKFDAYEKAQATTRLNTLVDLDVADKIDAEAVLAALTSKQKGKQL